MKRATTVLVSGILACLCVTAQTEPDYGKNRYSTQVLRPPDYDTFRPPAAGQTFRCPVFGTEIKVITDDHSIIGWNGERSNFSQDDRYFFIGVKLPGRGAETWLYDGRTGAFIKKIPISAFDTARWGYDPKVIVYFIGKQIRGYNVETGEDVVIKDFKETLGNGKGSVCGGDGHDFDDKGEWVLLEFGSGYRRMFAYNIRTGATGREFSLPQKTKKGKRVGVDYATISPSGKYVVVNKGLHGPHLRGGTGLYDRNGRFLRYLTSDVGHMDFGYYKGTEECIVMKTGKGKAEWKTRKGIETRGLYGVLFSNGEVVRLARAGTIWRQYSAVGGSNRRYVYMALESDGCRPNDGKWSRYMAEIVEVPLDGSLKVRRFLHHRARPDDTGREEWGHHTWADQPELWVNHAGDRLFFRSNMCLEPGGYGQRYGHDLFLIKIPPR